MADIGPAAIPDVIADRIAAARTADERDALCAGASLQFLDGLAELAALPLGARRLVPGLHPERAPAIVAGGIILSESMRAFGLASIEVSEHDILEGCALEAVAARARIDR